MKLPAHLPLVVLFSLLGLSCLAGAQQSSSSAAVPPSAASAVENAAVTSSQIVIPGPLRSFLRMAGISRGIAPEEVIPLMSRNVYTQGYGISRRPTEYLVLLTHYVDQAGNWRTWPVPRASSELLIVTTSSRSCMCWAITPAQTVAKPTPRFKRKILNAPF